MPMRLSGLMSQMDTESIIQQLVNAKRVKVDDAKRAQTRLQWKQESWKGLNSKLVNLYNNTLNNMRFSNDYKKRITKVSNPNLVSVIAGENAVNSVQNLEIKKLACSGYLTGEKLTGSTKYTKDTKLTAPTADGGLGLAVGSTVEVSVEGKTTQITIDENTTIKGFLDSMQKAGVGASFDETNQRFYVNAAKSGKDFDFTLTGVNADGNAALKGLGLSFYGTGETARYQAVIDNEADTKASRIQEQINNLSSRKKSLDNNKKSLMKLVNETYSHVFADLPDKTDITAIKAKINTLDPGSKEYKALKNWGSTYDANETALTEIADSLVENTTPDADGNPVTTYSLTATAEQEIIDQVDTEVAYARQALADIANGTLTGSDARRTAGTDAEILLNNADYSSSTNTFEINGLTLTVNAETAPGEKVTITTMDDTDGIYDMIRGFLKEYNGIINEMDKLYNAESARGYEPLTKEEKESMSDSEIEEWEKKIKDSILRRDSTLGTVSGAIKDIMSKGVDVNGNKMYLSDFGIETLSYFIAPEGEKNAYHIAGDSEDGYTSGEGDKLKTMIANDPDTVVGFFTGLSRDLYSKMSDLMKGTDYSSAYTIYEDKKMKADYKDYTAKIKDLEKKLSAYEDKWYAKFAAMETAMAKMQKNASAVTSLLGG